MAQKASDKDKGQKIALTGRPLKGQMRRYSLQMVASKREGKKKKPSSQDTSCLTLKASRVPAKNTTTLTPRHRCGLHNTKELFPVQGQDSVCGWNPVLVHTALQQNTARMQQASVFKTP